MIQTCLIPPTAGAVLTEQGAVLVDRDSFDTSDRAVLTAPLPDDLLEVHDQLEQGAVLVEARLVAVQEGHQGAQEGFPTQSTAACTP